MISVKANTTLIGVSELRSGIDKILKKADEGHVFIQKRNKTAAILMSCKEYENMQNLIETAEDLLLGFLADERYRKSNKDDYLDIESLLK